MKCQEITISLEPTLQQPRNLQVNGVFSRDSLVKGRGAGHSPSFKSAWLSYICPKTECQGREAPAGYP